MPVQALTLETIAGLDMGKVAETMAMHLGRAAADCEDRPHDASPRKVILAITLSPSVDPEGHMEDVKAQFFVESKVPSHRTKVYSMGVRRTPGRGVGLVYNEDSPTNINQGTLYDNDSEGE
jgi:hypothetical protein